MAFKSWPVISLNLGSLIFFARASYKVLFVFAIVDFSPPIYECSIISA